MIRKEDDGATLSFQVFFTGGKAAEDFTVWYATDADHIKSEFMSRIYSAFESDAGIFRFTNFEWGTEIVLNLRNIERIEV